MKEDWRRGGEEGRGPVPGRCSTRVCIRLSFPLSESFAEITDGELYDALVPRDEDYQRWEDDFEEDETDRGRRETRNIGWPSERCESYTSLSEHEDEPDTTDPYLSHKLYASIRRLEISLNRV